MSGRGSRAKIAASRLVIDTHRLLNRREPTCAVATLISRLAVVPASKHASSSATASSTAEETPSPVKSQPGVSPECGEAAYVAEQLDTMITTTRESKAIEARQAQAEGEASETAARAEGDTETMGGASSAARDKQAEQEAGSGATLKNEREEEVVKAVRIDALKAELKTEGDAKAAAETQTETLRVAPHVPQEQHTGEEAADQERSQERAPATEKRGPIRQASEKTLKIEQLEVEVKVARIAALEATKAALEAERATQEARCRVAAAAKEAALFAAAVSNVAQRRGSRPSHTDDDAQRATAASKTS